MYMPSLLKAKASSKTTNVDTSLPHDEAIETMASTLTLLTTRRHCFGSCPISRATKEPKTDDKGVTKNQLHKDVRAVWCLPPAFGV
ncbi:hypothetical protein JHK87_024813 [Glycine soja]|nr:hypothetical protein JHK87_024813 [Glycine soja]